MVIFDSNIEHAGFHYEERIETTVLRNLIYNEEFSRKVIPFIQPDYFEQRSEKGYL